MDEPTADREELEHLRLESRRLRFLLRFHELTSGDRGPDMLAFIDGCLAAGETPDEAAAVASLGATLRRFNDRRGSHKPAKKPGPPPLPRRRRGGGANPPAQPA
jgi:hypothetical protein